MARDAGGFGELTARYIDDNLELWRRYGEGLRQLSEGSRRRTPNDPRRAASSADLTSRARSLMELSVNHYAGLLKTYADFASRLVVNVLLPTVDNAIRTTSSTATADDAPAPSGTRPDAPNQIELKFTGRPDQTASQSFVVANRKTADLDVAFELTEFVREDGRSRFRAQVTFVPERFVLPPGAEQVVECRIRMGEPFTVGARHVAMLRVPGFEDIQAVLLVMPRPVPVTPPETISPSPATGRVATAPRKPSQRKSAPPARTRKMSPAKQR